MQKKMIFVSLLIFGVGLLRVCEGFGTGAPAGACVHMTPGHLYDGNASDPISPQESASPFGISVNKSTYGPEEDLEITLEATTSFVGFFIQARPSGEDEPVGAFSGLQTKMQTVEACSTEYPSAAITHADQAPPTPWDSSFTVTWTAPDEDVGDITFYATVAQDHDNFWVKVPSENIAYSGCPVLSPTITMVLLSIVLAVTGMM